MFVAPVILIILHLSGILRVGFIWKALNYKPNLGIFLSPVKFVADGDVSLGDAISAALYLLLVGGITWVIYRGQVEANAATDKVCPKYEPAASLYVFHLRDPITLPPGVAYSLGGLLYHEFLDGTAAVCEDRSLQCLGRRSLRKAGSLP